jgi:O-antigen/teichoic acid export membrane protein
MFVSSLLYARWLGPHEYGQYALVIAIVGLLPLIGGLGLDEAITSFMARLGAAGTAAQQAYLMRVALAVRVMTSLVLGLVVWLARDPIASFAGAPDIAPYLALAGPYLLAQQVFGLLLSAALGRLASGMATIARLVSLALSIGLATWLLGVGLGVTGILVAVTTAVGLAAGCLCYLERHALFGPVQAVPLTPIWRFGCAAPSTRRPTSSSAYTETVTRMLSCRARLPCCWPRSAGSLAGAPHPRSCTPRIVSAP